MSKNKDVTTPFNKVCLFFHWESCPYTNFSPRSAITNLPKKKVPVNSLILSHLTCRQFLVFHLKKQYFFNRNVYYRSRLIKCYGMMSTTDSQSHFAY